MFNKVETTLVQLKQHNCWMRLWWNYQRVNTPWQMWCQPRTILAIWLNIACFDITNLWINEPIKMDKFSMPLLWRFFMPLYMLRFSIPLTCGLTTINCYWGKVISSKQHFGDKCTWERLFASTMILSFYFE
jgi:hypothetical protein